MCLALRILDLVIRNNWKGARFGTVDEYVENGVVPSL